MRCSLLARFAILLLTTCRDAWVGAFSPLNHGRTSLRSMAHSMTLAASVEVGDTILVVGGTSGIGQLVTQKLAAAGISVRATSRDKARGEDILGNNPNIQVVALDLLQNDTASLQDAMKDVVAVVITVGTTAFPTMKWRGGNNPVAIDKDAVARLAVAAATESNVQKVVLVTSVGVDRTADMPFKMLNLFGVLDAKKAGEESVKMAASTGSGFDYVIVRPGRLVGGPFTNLDVAKLLQIQGGAENGVEVALGDALLGDCKRDACAECIVQCLTNVAAANVEFSIVSNDERALTDDEWTLSFQTMLGAAAKQERR
jgi:nucleoside-diphosphate-sugar epimerase